MENNGKNLEEKLCDMFTPGTKENKELGEYLHKKVCFINSIRRAYGLADVAAAASSVASCYNAIKEVITGYKWPVFVEEYKHAMAREAKHAPKDSLLYSSTDTIMQEAEEITKRDKDIWRGIVLPEILQNDESKRVLYNAIQKDVIRKEGNELKRNVHKVLLVYLLARLCCGDEIVDNRKLGCKEYKRTSCIFEETPLGVLFGESDMSKSRKKDGDTPPRGYEKIDSCFD